MATRRTASMARASSPPEAALARGRTASPTLAPKAISTGSPVPSGATRISTRAPGMARSARRSPTSAPNFLAALVRTARTLASATSSCAASSARVASSAAALVLGVLELVEAGGGLVGEGHHRRQVDAVLAAQVGQEAPALLHGDQAFGIVLPSLHLVAQAAGDVGEVDGRGRDPLPVLVEGLPAGQQPRRLGQAGQHPAVAVARGRFEELPGAGRRPRGGPWHRPGGSPAGAGGRPPRGRTGGPRRSPPPGSAARRPPGPGPARRPPARPPTPRSPAAGPAGRAPSPCRCRHRRRARRVGPPG